MAVYIVFDVETPNRANDRMSAIGITAVKNNKIVAIFQKNSLSRRMPVVCGLSKEGVIPNEFRMKDGHYENICPYYIEL